MLKKSDNISSLCRGGAINIFNIINYKNQGNKTLIQILSLRVVFVVDQKYSIQLILNLHQVTLRAMIQLLKYFNNRKGYTLDQENSPDTKKGLSSGMYWYSCLDVRPYELKWYESVRERLNNKKVPL